MTGLLVVVSGPDPTTELIVDAAVGSGVPVQVIDLRCEPLTLSVGSDPALRSGGQQLRPSVVLNATTTNRLGLASVDALARQRSSRWMVRHVAAREEQGLLLAALRLLRDQGAILLNPPVATDLALMPLLVAERLSRQGVEARPGADAGSTTEIMMTAGRMIRHRGEQATSTLVELAGTVASAAGFVLGSVTIDRGEPDHPVVTGWQHRPDFSRWADPAGLATAVLDSLPSLGPTRPPATGGGLFVTDLVAGEDDGSSR